MSAFEIVMAVLGVFYIIWWIFKRITHFDDIKNTTKYQHYFSYNDKQYKEGTEILVEDLETSEIISAVFMYYDIEKKLFYYEPVVGDTIVHCTKEWLDGHFHGVTGNTYDLKQFKSEKSKYNNFMYVCPMCKSRRVKSISTEKRVASTVAFGFASSNFGKNYQCDGCDYKW